MSDELPVTVNLRAYHGDVWSQTFQLTEQGQPHDVSSAQIDSWVRNDDGVTTPLITGTTENVGEVTIFAPSEGLPAGNYDYDVQLIEGGSTLTWVKGQLFVAQDVTDVKPETPT